jgi:hypothetical protein
MTATAGRPIVCCAFLVRSAKDNGPTGLDSPFTRQSLSGKGYILLYDLASTRDEPACGLPEGR